MDFSLTDLIFLRTYLQLNLKAYLQGFLHNGTEMISDTVSIRKKPHFSYNVLTLLLDLDTIGNPDLFSFINVIQIRGITLMSGTGII
ncbi:MAG: hypothetical protein IPI04_18675 [Ignavibacteria bacterium]|nr:hypothetical protein [Ignavibacteria bacterium]